MSCGYGDSAAVCRTSEKKKYYFHLYEFLARRAQNGRP
jgi:hypothetical protein